MTRDEVVPEGRWEFGADVTDAFDDMLARSIPDHDTMRAMVADYACRLLRPGDAVLDLGASRGEAIASVLASERCPNPVSAVAVEVSAPMRDALAARFADDPRVQVLDTDLRDGFPAGRFGVVLSVLTVQFTPIEHRFRILADARDSLRDGGALILVEKCLGSTALLDRLHTESYRDHKRAVGYSEEQIIRKANALEGVLVPVTADWNTDLLTRSGFGHVDRFWQSGPFAAWVAVP